MAPSKTIIQLTATSHFPIKLTAANFLVWRKQVQSALIGLALDDFITSSITEPSKTLTKYVTTTPNPAYTYWYRQDQIIFSFILGSCSDVIQLILTSASSTKEVGID